MLTIEGLKKAIKETMKYGEYGLIPSYDYDNIDLYFYNLKTSSLYQYISSELELDEKTKEELEITFRWNLYISFGILGTIKPKTLALIDETLKAEVTTEPTSNNIAIMMDDISIETIEELFNEYKENIVPYKYMTPSKYERIFCNRSLKLIKVKNYQYNESCDKLCMEFKPELQHTFGYHEYIVNENPEDFVHMEAVTDLYKKTEIKMVTIDNYSKHCSCILEEREDENTVIVYWFCGTYYAFDLNPTNNSKCVDNTKRYFYELM